MKELRTQLAEQKRIDHTLQNQLDVANSDRRRNTSQALKSATQGKLKAEKAKKAALRREKLALAELARLRRAQETAHEHFLETENNYTRVLEKLETSHHEAEVQRLRHAAEAAEQK